MQLEAERLAVQYRTYMAFRLGAVTVLGPGDQTEAPLARLRQCLLLFEKRTVGWL